MKVLPFGEWLPDQPALGKGLMVANNCYPGARGYRPAKAFTAQYAALGAPFKGAASFFRATGGAIVIGATVSNIYHVAGSGWTVIIGTFATPANGRWRFAQFGELALATNDVNPIQKVDLATLGGAALGGSPPVTRLLAVVKDFLVAGVLNGQTNMFGWSGINDAEWWTWGQNQSDYQIMPSGGDINGILGGEFGLILQRSRITRMDYVGGNEIFVISEVSTNYGCVTPNSVVQHGQLGFFLSENGFVMWDGTQLKPIGNESIDRYFTSSYARGSWGSMYAAVNAEEQVVCWSMGDRMFCYHIPTNRWSTVSLAAEVIFGGASLSTSPTDQDTTFYAIDTSHVLGRFIGSPLEATWQFHDIEAVSGREAQIRAVRVDTDASTGVSVGIASRLRLGDVGSEHVYSTIQANGDIPVRERGRYQRIAVSIAAGTAWTYAQGLELDLAAGAGR